MNSGFDPSSEDEFALALDAEGLRSAAVRGSVVIAGAQVIKAAMMFASQVALARILMPSDFGLVAMVGPAISLAMILNSMGMAESLVQRATLDSNRIAVIFWGSFGISVALALACCALSPLVALFYGNTAVIPLLILATVAVPISTLGSVPGALLARRMQFRQLQQNELISTAAGLIATVSLALSGFGYWSLPLGSLFSALLSMLMLWRRCQWRPIWPTDWRAGIGDLAFGANLTTANVATFVTTTADNLIVGAVNGAQALGYYDRSYRLITQPIGQMLAPIGGVAIPLLSRLRDDAPEYRKAFFRLLRASLILTLPPMVFCIAFGDRIVPLLLGARWLPAAPTFSWIAVGGLASGLYTSLAWLFISEGRTSDMRTAFVIAAVLNVTSFGIGSQWGVAGIAGWGAVVFVSVTTPLSMYFATKGGGPVTVGDLARFLMPYAIAVATSLSTAFYLKPLLPVAPFGWIPFAGAALVSAFAAPILLFSGERAEIDLLVSKGLAKVARVIAR